MEITCHPIATVRSNYKSRSEIPIYPIDIKEESEIHVLPEYLDCIDGLEKHKYIYVIMWFHLSDRNVQTVHLRSDPNRATTGVLCTRAPCRPNPITMTLVEITGIDKNVIFVKGLDALDSTPVLDLKPFDSGMDTPDVKE